LPAARFGAISFFVQIRLDVVADQHHDRVGGFGRVGGRHHAQAGGFRFGPALRSRIQADDHVRARIAQIQRVRMSLATVADHGEHAVLQKRRVAVFFVIAIQHS